LRKLLIPGLRPLTQPYNEPLVKSGARSNFEGLRPASSLEMMRALVGGSRWTTPTLSVSSRIGKGPLKKGFHRASKPVIALSNRRRYVRPQLKDSQTLCMIPRHPAQENRVPMMSPAPGSSSPSTDFSFGQLTTVKHSAPERSLSLFLMGPMAAGSLLL